MTPAELKRIFRDMDVDNSRLARSIALVSLKRPDIFKVSDKAIVEAYLATCSWPIDPDDAPVLVQIARKTRHYLQQERRAHCPICKRLLHVYNDDAYNIGLYCYKDGFNFVCKPRSNFLDATDTIESMGKTVIIKTEGVVAIACPVCGKTINVTETIQGHVRCRHCGSWIPRLFFRQCGLVFKNGIYQRKEGGLLHGRNPKSQN